MKGLPLKRAVTKRFNLALTAHLNHRHPQPKAWERVLRRFYTLSRTIDNDFLTRRWGRDLRDHPGSADHVLEYMSTHRLTVGRALEAEARLKELGGVYEDVELMTRHYLAIAPNLDGTHLRAFLSDWSLETLRHSLKSSPRLASACAVVVGKFGHDRHMDALADLFRSDMRRDDPARQHSALVLTATGRLSTDDLRRLLGRSSPESVQQIEFLLALLAGDTAAAARGIGSIQPSPRQNPQRAMVRPRSMFLAPLLRAASPIAWTKAEARFLKSLRANRLRHRDLASERWLQT